MCTINTVFCIIIIIIIIIMDIYTSRLMVFIIQYISILFSPAVYSLSYTVARVVIFEYKCMHVVFQYTIMLLQTNRNILEPIPKTVDFHL